MKAVEGREYGPFRVRACQERVDDFVSATGDDPGRWGHVAPPGFAAALLFAAAPAFFSDPDVASQAGSVVHGDQLFRWFGPLPLEEDLEVTGRIERVRSRAGVWFVSFSVGVEGAAGSRLEASSTFLLSPGSALIGEAEGGGREPGPEEKGPDHRPDPIDLPAEGGKLPPLPKSASRADLIRYAAATRDWNPIHWDRAAARRAGLPGVVCHGLLMASWAAQGAARISRHPAPLEELRVRFRAPLGAGVPAWVLVTVRPGAEGPVPCDVAVEAEGEERVSGRALVRLRDDRSAPAGLD